MKAWTLQTWCARCGCPLQWKSSDGANSGLTKHYETVHPEVGLDLREYPLVAT